MKTDIIKVAGNLEGMELAIEAEEKFAAYYGITGREALHLRLLTEEVISMIHGIFDDFLGEFWLESERSKKGLLCRICLSAEKHVNKEQEAHMLSVSSSGKNESARGIAGKIRELLRQSLQDASEDDVQYLSRMTDAWVGTGMTGTIDSNYWSLQIYRQNVSAKKTEQRDEWDELEKSIIAKIADEVKVWLDSGSTKVVIEKQLTI